MDYNSQHIPSADRDLNRNMKLSPTIKTASFGGLEKLGNEILGDILLHVYIVEKAVQLDLEHDTIHCLQLASN